MQELTPYILVIGVVAFLAIVGSFIPRVLRLRNQTKKHKMERKASELRCAVLTPQNVPSLEALRHRDDSAETVQALVIHSQRLRRELARG